MAALLVESADGRFRQALQAIAEYLPLIVVALRAWRGAGEVVLVPEPLIVRVANGTRPITDPEERQKYIASRWAASAA